ncbi:MAG TPA: carbohydrate kinase family protein [Chthoniobacterales bacterium]|nr:carbohydrate kinase family protein [Chthoniobacterales bacterium]
MTMARIGCAGILVKDTFCGPLKTLPVPGELVAIEAFKTRVGGCAANVAIDLRKQSQTVELVGCIGQDAAGAYLVKELQAAQVNCDQLAYIEEHPTSETVILLVAGEDRRYLHSFGANRAFKVSDIHRDWVAALDLFYLGGLFAMPAIAADELIALLAFAREQKVITVVDVVLPTNFKRAAEMERLLPHVDWFLPNEAEAAALTGKVDPLEAIRTFRSWGGHDIIVTLGDQGAVAVFEDECWRANAHPGQMVDPSGAGDAFASGLISGIAKGWAFPKSLQYASLLGASATWMVGTTDGVLTGAQAERIIAENPVKVHKITRPNVERTPNAPH